VDRSDLVIYTATGAALHVVGLRTPSRIEGEGWDGGVMDENCDLPPDIFAQVVRPALADRRGWLWRIGVPKRHGPGAAEYRRFCEQCASGEYPDGVCFTWPSRDILPPEEIAHARATLDPKDFREQYEACWETAGGGVFYAFSKEYNIRPCHYNPKLALVIGSDFNVDPLCWVIGHCYPDRMEWFKEIWLRNANTQAALECLYDLFRDHRAGFRFYGDATSRGRSTSAAASDYMQILNDPRFQRLGRTVHYPATNPPTADRFAACNAMFENAAGERRMFIDPACKQLIEDLEVRAYKPGTREPADVMDVGHMSDAMGYAVHWLFPIRLEMPARGTGAVITQGY